MGIIAWLIVGLIAGALARLFVPGRDEMGWVGTMLLGLVGSVIGGLIGDMLTSGEQDFSPAGLIGSVLGAVLAFVIYRATLRRRTA